MSVDLAPDTERRIEEAVRQGRFSSPAELVEAAVNNLLRLPESGRFHQLRAEIEAAGLPLLSDDELAEEIRSRRGRHA